MALSSDLRARAQVYFTGPNPEMSVECLPSPKCDAAHPKYPPITMEENVEMKISAGAQVSDETADRAFVDDSK